MPIGSMESYLLYTTRNLLHFIKNKSVHMSIKLYSLPYKNAIIQLSNLCFLCQNSLQTCHYYLLLLNKRDRPAQQSSSGVFFVIFKVNIDKKEQISARDQVAASKKAGTCLWTRHENHLQEFTALSQPTAFGSVGPELTLKQEMKPPGKAVQSWECQSRLGRVFGK